MTQKTSSQPSDLRTSKGDIRIELYPKNIKSIAIMQTSMFCQLLAEKRIVIGGKKVKRPNG